MFPPPQIAFFLVLDFSCIKNLGIILAKASSLLLADTVKATKQKAADPLTHCWAQKLSYARSQTSPSMLWTCQVPDLKDTFRPTAESPGVFTMMSEGNRKNEN